MTTRNAAVGMWRAYLTNRAARLRDGRFLIHGSEPIGRAVAHGWPLETLVYRLGGPDLPSWARALVDTSPVASVGLVPELMAELGESSTGTPDLVAVARVRNAALTDFAPGAVGLHPVVVVLDRATSAPGLGGVIRTAHAFGAAGVLVAGTGADFYDPHCVRVAAGAQFAVPVFRIPGVAAVGEFRDRQAARGIATRVVGVTGTVAGEPRPLAEYDFAGATIIVIGDAADLGPGWSNGCDAVTYLPAAGSLPAPCVASVVLYEISRQHRALCIDAGGSA